ncbi:MAG: sulfurtransferase [Betaproteobacteria bacterium]|nr:sulfurtransferase [Betaproteobacteria bacterium]
MRVVTIWLALLWSAAAAGADFLVSGEGLSAEMKHGRVRLIDAENAENFARAHLPGAANLYYMELEDAEENAKTGLPVFPQLGASKFAALGLTRDADIVVYDGGDGRAASAVWYILRFLGHEKVRILDGGFRKWLKEGRPVTQDVPKLVKATYAPKPRADWAVKTRDLDPGRMLVLDARGLGEFAGKETGGARQGGHIPGAQAFPWTRLAGESASFRSPDEMRKILAAAGINPDQEIVTYCNPGLGRSTWLLAALTLAGYDKVKVYPGSWIEWASDPGRPIER